ncbi:heme biosynthesis protein HemY [Pseudorhizobium endolithicum]|uniref:Heme biosynthesis protein HemY n=1 Tax=Pseudorhizobium endolithicum TaxID=1191678 RepID=A0ABN7JSG4_9HYPH|nr:heme biosynthesis protein HemY [Pseudorhizobium endolithicum]CAD6431875.1 heme biosynthesis protein HemY [Rhizobium sp. Q54]CAD7042767.1 heme biosynthesis protein HemY [Pseudorhizobium endolithicum]
MIRIFVFILVVLALGWSFSWLADRPGLISITWQDYLIETSLMVAATALAAVIAAIMILWWLVQLIWTSPHSVRRYFRARKRDRGYQALSTGLIAAGAGNAILARKMSLRAQGLLRADQEPLLQLLDAQAALIEGRHDDARRRFERMAEDPETRELGLRGLYVEARRAGADEAARQYAERAAEHAPYLPWAAEATLEARCRDGRWDEAIRLLEQQRIASVIDRKQADRWKAVLLTAKAGERLESEPKAARDDALAALKLAKDLVPAAVIAAKGYLREDNIRRAASVLEGVWKAAPHPEIARTYVRARSGDSAVDRLKRAEKLEAIRPNNVESLVAVAEAALDARELERARAKAEAAARMGPRESIYLLLADIEEADTGDQGRIRHWMAQALRAPRDPAWVADGLVSEQWLPMSPVSGRIDAFEWKVPFGQLEGPIEEGDPTGGAIAELPPVASEPEPEQQRTAAVVDVTPAAQPEPEPSTGMAGDDRRPEQKRVVPIAAAMENTTQPPKPEEEPDPFFGRPPDDPGVKDPASSEPANRLRLF